MINGEAQDMETVKMKTCKKCEKTYNAEDDGRGLDMDNGFCSDCDLKQLQNL